MSRSRAALALVASILTLSSAQAPVDAAMEVIVIRHADKDNTRGAYNLSPLGFARAIGLARLIPACLGVPSAITTYPFDSATGKNARSYQSAVPLAVATGVTIRIAPDAPDDSFAVGLQLRQRAIGSNERQVLFWEHRRIPELARGLGWEALAPIAANDFDQIFLFRYASADARPRLSVIRQSELARQPCFGQSRFPLAERWSLPFNP